MTIAGRAGPRAATCLAPRNVALVPESVAIEFANTRSSTARDRIATLADWRSWIKGWPGLRSVGLAVEADGLVELRSLRDDLQLFLRASVVRRGFEATSAVRLVELACSVPCAGVDWVTGHATLVAPVGAAPGKIVAQHLARSALDLLVSGPPLAACEGQDCLKLFVDSRPQRRWCDTAVCGNRARVARFARRRRDAASDPK